MDSGLNVKCKKPISELGRGGCRDYVASNIFALVDSLEFVKYVYDFFH